MSKPDIIRDPRPDLAYDSREWTALLTAVHQWDKHVAGILHGFRCGGLRLHRGGKGYALRPDFNTGLSKWPNRAAYEADRDKWLTPHSDIIVAGLRILNEAERADAS